MCRNKIVAWLLFVVSSCSLISTASSGPEIWRSGVMAMTACEQWEEFNKTGKIPEPIKSTGNRKLCGWFKKGVEGDACADIRHFWFGCHISNASERITGGVKARKNGFPSTLLYGGYRCGASILNEEWALTASHCLQKDDSYFLYAGHKLTSGDNATEQEVKTTGLFYHPKYNHSNQLRFECYALSASDLSDFLNDIALVKFAPKLRFTDAVQPARLPDKTDFHSEGLIGVSVGWGKGSEGVLSEVELAVITPEKCREVFKPKNITVTDLIVCGQYPSGDVRNACHGDSGSPFFVCENNKLIQIGVADFIGGCHSYYPVGFARVTKFLDWIEETMAKN